MSNPLKLKDLTHIAGFSAFLGAGVGSMIGRSSPRMERLWVRVIYVIAKRLKRVQSATQDNLRTCFPDKAAEEINTLADLATREVARSIVETFKVWFPRRSRGEPYSNVEYHGLEHFEAALSKDRGILLLNCHFGSLDLNGSFVGRLNRRGRRLIGVYRRPSNPYADKVLQHARTSFVDRAIPINEPRAILAELKAGSIVWIAPDLEASGPRAVFVDFFGVPASTTTWPSRIAAMSNAVVLPVRHTRLGDGYNYAYEFLAPFKAFPSGNDAKDARRFNKYIEHVIKQKPEMYWWCIKRFKHRPAPAAGDV